ncbi:hypothetical protein VM1G_11743 [Cytospora mali]|uniref:Uncharacterized protein n=1 Tax=Cytospora mali TaxID=578113 RepID=A0A194W602_CYTMA|nr:hypothetical protein VM1G_11743 [Valsa mali]
MVGKATSIGYKADVEAKGYKRTSSSPVKHGVRWKVEQTRLDNEADVSLYGRSHYDTDGTGRGLLLAAKGPLGQRSQSRVGNGSVQRTTNSTKQSIFRSV